MKNFLKMILTILAWLVAFVLIILVGFVFDIGTSEADFDTNESNKSIITNNKE